MLTQSFSKTSVILNVEIVCRAQRVNVSISGTVYVTAFLWAFDRVYVEEGAEAERFFAASRVTVQDPYALGELNTCQIST